MFKKVLTGLLATNFALGAISCGVEKAEERTLATMSAIEQRLDEIKPDCPITTKQSSPYVKKNLGTFSLTFYVPGGKWGRQTATQEEPVHLKTCAVDPSVIPYGSVIQITGNNGQTLTLRANDCGNGIKGNKIDIFWDGSVASGYDWIAQFGTIHSVYLMEE